ncbi:hypothetical protein [Cohnella abietis]|uniref:Pilus assembly protein TadE n=1 Tax=Cohnella abietis TaxID=2507935 RepID=A0A3T1D1T9_9BACL|nr:hypothetical protein [Cohnella abietis]BBI32070.1 hypothetical protein KCTCHS21_14690 [Cohnella abietis]
MSGSTRAGCWGNSSGSITLEASMVFPWVFMMTFLLLLFSLFISQGAFLYYSSSIMAERTAFSWSNSAKETSTGAYPSGQYDGLYWRFTDDSLVQGLFGLVSDNKDSSVVIGPGITEGRGSKAEDKLRKVAFEMVTSRKVGKGQISYFNVGVKRNINVDLTSGWLVKPLGWLRGQDTASASVSALVVEPTEFLRSFDLVRYYAAKMKVAKEGPTEYRNKIGDVLKKRGL